MYKKYNNFEKLTAYSWYGSHSININVRKVWGSGFKFSRESFKHMYLD